MLSPQSQPSTFCLAFLRRAACIGKWLSQAVFKPYVFLRGLLLLAGDVEPNPGPIQGRQREASCQHSWMCCERHNGSGGCGGRCVYSGVILVDTRYLELSVLGDLILLRSAYQFCICTYNLHLGSFYSR